MNFKPIIILSFISIFFYLHCIDLTEQEVNYEFVKYGFTETDSLGKIIDDFGDWQPRGDIEYEHVYFLPPYPNPCKNSITFKYYLKTKVEVWISLWSLQWHEELYKSTFIKDLVDCVQDTGFHEIYWDCTDQYGNKLPNGFYRIGFNLQFENYDIGYCGGNIQIIR